MPARASSSPSIMPAGPPPAMTTLMRADPPDTAVLWRRERRMHAQILYERVAAERPGSALPALAKHAEAVAAFGVETVHRYPVRGVKAQRKSVDRHATRNDALSRGPRGIPGLAEPARDLQRRAALLLEQPHDVRAGERHRNEPVIERMCRVDLGIGHRAVALAFERSADTTRVHESDHGAQVLRGGELRVGYDAPERRLTVRIRLPRERRADAAHDALQISRKARVARDE